MGNMKKKYESGEGSLYLTRKQALRKLQLSLKMFRRLCILKGIYPREPKNRKKAQRGSTDKKTLYLKKDIQFLMHEPIIWKLREEKIYLRKKKSAKGTKDYERFERICKKKPILSIDHIIKERFPTFIDALRDMDDCLTLCFLFSTFPSLKYVSSGLSLLCRRLTIEFLHYVIETRTLRKVFVSIKGYYYQVEIKGQVITWIVPHNFGFCPQSPSEVDFRIMATFVDFYSTLLGFINFRLYHESNICYPPKILSTSTNLIDGMSEDEFIELRVASLNQKIIRIQEDEADSNEIETDQFPSDADNNKVAELKGKAERLRRLKSLFNGLKVFLSREVPRESLTFCIRAFGGEVSWDSKLFPGGTFVEDDQTITHQIVDRNSVNEKQYLSRYYIQPQWIFDSINNAMLAPVEQYFQGAILPPHVSPFAVEREGDYIPPEKRKFLDMEKGIVTTDQVFENVDSTETSAETGDPIALAYKSASDRKQKKKTKSTKEENKPAVPMVVERGIPESLTPTQKEQENKEEYKLREMMIKNKHKRLYKKMMISRGKRSREANKMVQKRQVLSS